MTTLQHFLVLVLLFACDSDSKTDPQKERKLIWSDEFEKTGLPDPSKWDYEAGLVRNNEAQYYTRANTKNARVENGMLVIEAHKESFENAQYTSASLITKGKKSFKYHRIEVRAKLPMARGTWPAIWLLGENINQKGWPACGEIDIMENVGFDSLRIHANIHTEAYNHVKKTNKGNSIIVSKPWEDFHVYTVDWQKDKLDFFVDDQLYFTFKKERQSDDVWPFDNPHYLILNLAIGGAWGGQKGIDDKGFPHQYFIDYVRVYE
jgi:beta-glucanase (GH16 family)